MKRDLIVHEFPKSPVSESIRLIRTNLTYRINRSASNVILTVSTMPGEGKSWITANLAIAYAQSNKKVLIIDSDLRKGRQHKIFGKYNTIGFSDYLQTAVNMEKDPELHKEVIMKSITITKVPNLFLLHSGPTPSNPSELLENVDLDFMLKILKETFDVILIDAPPVSIVADSLILARVADTTIIVSAINETKKDMLINTKKSLERVGAKIAGVVVNKMPNELRKEYNKYYAHYYEDGLVESKGPRRNRSSR